MSSVITSSTFLDDDQTIPNYLETTVGMFLYLLLYLLHVLFDFVFTQIPLITEVTDMNTTHIELEEFHRNEEVVALLEEVLCNVENEAAIVLTSTNNITTIAEAQEYEHQLEEVDDDDDEENRMCSKRIMNNSIISIGDPAVTLSKKRRSTNHSIIECNDNAGSSEDDEDINNSEPTSSEVDKIKHVSV